MPVIEVRHPLVRHKVGLLREADISTKKFREVTSELARLLTYEATADFPLEKTTIQCWSGPTEVERISGKKVTVVPILRAGLGMQAGVLDLIPSARSAWSGFARNHETLQPENYFERFVGHLGRAHRDHHRPMLATAGLDDRDGQPAEVARLHRRAGAGAGRGAGGRSRRSRKAHPDCACWTAALTATSMKLVTSFRGWGCGDKIFGTK
jgi:uracil phosphoribosyltransferase